MIDALPYKPLVEMSEEELLEALKDPHWRLRNLYYIKDKDGRTVLFSPNEVQEKFLENLWYRNIVPKARQRGFSTLVQLLMLDTALFVPNTEAAIIAQDQPTAKKIRDQKIKFAYNRLPPLVKAMVPLVTDNVTELSWKNESLMTVTSSARGGTIDFLHVSEYGVICRDDPLKAEEIQEGSFPAVPVHGISVVESTVESPFGIFSNMVKQAEADVEAKKRLTPLDYRLHFASWWDSDEYRLPPRDVVISPQDHAYFNRIEGEIGRPIDLDRRAWYVTVRRSDFGGSNEKMHRQYPSSLREAFEVSTDGLWLAEVLAIARKDKRITRVPLDPSRPVNTLWDIGTDDNTSIWLHQQVLPRDHLIGFIEGSGEPPSYYVRELQKIADERRFVWGKHFLPHDGAHRRINATELVKYDGMLRQLGFKNVEIVPKADSVDHAIDLMREDFSNYWIDEEDCAEGLRHLVGFSKIFNTRMQIWTGGISENGHQHGADALRQLAQAKAAGLLRQPIHTGSGGRKKRRAGAMTA